MTWRSKAQKKPLSNSASTLQTSIFKQRGFSKPVADETQVQTQPEIVQRRGFDYRNLKVIPDSPSLVQAKLNDPFPIQTKLTVGAPGDKYEQEADTMASQVMSMPDSAVQREMAPEEEKEEEVQAKPLAAGITPLVQREAMPEEEEVQTKPLSNATIQREAMPEEEEIQTKPISASIQRETSPEEKEVQTKPTLQRSSDGSFQAGGNIESRLNSSKGGGSSLPDDVRGFMEPRFGTKFDNVRVHTGSEAVQMNRELGAQAFTHSSDVYFGAGKSPGNNELTAHELTHVVQQTQALQPKPSTIADVEVQHMQSDIDTLYSPLSLASNNPLIQRETTDVGETTFYSNDIPFTISADRANGLLIGLWDVGHTWIKFQVPEQAQESYGFYPKSNKFKGLKTAASIFAKKGLSKPLMLGVSGQLHHPDVAHTATDEKTVMINNSQLKKGIDYAKAHANNTYRLLGYNCTAFARGMFEAATGLSAPFAGTLIQDPKDFAKSIESEKNPPDKNPPDNIGHGGGPQSSPKERE